ncbi:uncharacterized protein LOC127831282 [Dreissena polymorpha]|uniref:uncharacterized protein LOC127831282 n=1 Tax=Dreissena polymorpha TaxID=45954 RepID=UPI002265399D|nr:uncharacterized protein LOC127831282 [Dreissena polymorpha]
MSFHFIFSYKNTVLRQPQETGQIQVQVNPTHLSSTPGPSQLHVASGTKTPSVSGVSGPDSEQSRDVKLEYLSKAGRSSEVKKLSDSFVDPFDPKEINEVAEDVAYEEAEFGMEIDGDTVDEGDMKGDDHTTAGPIQVCDDGHACGCWCSQPILNKRLHSGDFLVCSTILTSRNNYGKMDLWADMLHLKFPSADQFHRIQSTYLVPTIDRYWAAHQQEVISEFKDTEVIVLGKTATSAFMLRHVSLAPGHLEESDGCKGGLMD